MKKRQYSLLLILAIGLFSIQCVEKTSTTNIVDITISITDTETVILNDKPVLIVDLAKRLKDFDKSSKVKILPKKNTKMVTLNEVFKAIRTEGFANIENHQAEELATK
ncbi:MAG: hypothetical protein D8M58_03445 [Calditrichaeota bacterium]|nr:MAG: hypothetical protein DWQ03_03630 [Calditrichota bacterium]MBL1204421.1 hypothetical protein [Calditrichota bacterium]NOG44250.1 hypothetical protein [Calditrichota bacterium]